MEDVLEEKQPRLVIAILMAVVMGLVGCALFILLYYFGVIAWVAGFVLVLAAAWGYKKFNLKMDTKGYFIIAVIAIVEILLSLFVGLAIDCSEIFEVSFFESFGLLMELIEEYPELKSAVVGDAIFTLISIVVGFILLVSSERRSARAKQHEELLKEAEAKTNAEALAKEEAERYAVEKSSNSESDFEEENFENLDEEFDNDDDKDDVEDDEDDERDYN